LQISREALDEIAGLQSGYAAKLLAPKPSRKLGDMSMACMLPALGAKRVLVEDDDALAQINNRMVKRDSRAAMHAVAVHYQPSRRFLRRIARKGGLNSRKNLDPERRTELARKAAKARWSAVFR